MRCGNPFSSRILPVVGAHRPRYDGLMKLARMPDGSPEIFYTLQGEGRSTGRPSVFIRASLCNLHCRWCDTDYTWNWVGTDFEHEKDSDPEYAKYRREDQIIDLTTSEIAKAALAHPAENFVFTGGEPLIQESAWTELMASISEKRPNAEFEIETNGTLFPGSNFLERINRLNVSPKLSNSGVEESRRYVPEALTNLAATGKADFKFVVGGKADLEEILRIVEIASIPASNIFLMPKARTVDELEANQASVAEIAQNHGFRYSDRLHLRLYGAKRGT